MPEQLRERVRELMARLPEAELRRASQRLTEAYKVEGPPGALKTEAEQIAYLAVRLPATYGAVRTALQEASVRIEGFQPKTMLDLGSGPGTAVWAGRDVFPSLERFHAVERDEKLVALAKNLLPDHGGAVEWTQADLRNWIPTKKYGLVVASYSLGELRSDERTALIRRVWDATDGVFLLVEPGTRKGFMNVVEAREQFLRLGVELAAPCPHALACPMQVAGDWCHFPVRVERTAEHRRLKGGELGYEDEKFSYVVASKVAAERAGSRVVRHPMRYSGHTKLQLCTPEGLAERTVTRSKKELYRQAKRAEWGSGWEE